MKVSRNMRVVSFALEEKDKILLYETAERMGLLPCAFMRMLMLRALRSEVARLNKESAASDSPLETHCNRTDQ